MGGFLSRRLDPELHGSSSVTTTARLVSLAWGLSLVAIAVYLGFTAAYNGRFMPGVATASRSLAGLTRSEARPLLESDFAAYRLHLDVAGKPRQVAPTELGTSFNLDATLASAYQIGRRSNWLIPGLPSPHLPKAEVAYQLDRSKLAAYSKAISNELGVAPRNAAIIITAGQPAVQPEQSGWGVNDQALDQVLEASVAAVSTETIPILPHKVAAPVSATAVAPALATTKQILATPITLTYADKTFSPSPAEVGSWVTYSLNPSGTGLIPGIDSARLKDYVNQIANQINVAPISQKVTVNNGVSQVDQIGVNGLAIDQDALTAAITKALMGQQSLAYAISTSPVAFKTLTTNHISLDYGQYIEVNLTTQHLWVYQDHQVIYDSPITSGATGAGLGTVTGLFSIYYKTTNTHLVGYQYGYNYDVPVKYWMPFYSGYGLHDAVWRNGNFGGPDYYYGGSHGCVNLPDATAAFIYNWSVVGTPVWIHN